MTNTVTVSAKVPVELRRKLAELGIVPSEVIRKALEEAVEGKSPKGILERDSAHSEIANSVTKADWSRSIREDRSRKERKDRRDQRERR